MDGRPHHLDDRVHPADRADGTRAGVAIAVGLTIALLADAALVTATLWWIDTHWTWGVPVEEVVPATSSEEGMQLILAALAVLGWIFSGAAASAIGGRRFGWLALTGPAALVLLVALPSFRLIP